MVLLGAKLLRDHSACVRWRLGGSRATDVSDDVMTRVPSCLCALGSRARGTNAVELQRSTENVLVPFCCSNRSAELHSISLRCKRRTISASIISRLIVSTDACPFPIPPGSTRAETASRSGEERDGCRWCCFWLGPDAATKENTSMWSWELDNA